MTYAFVKYWVEGERDALQSLYEAIKNGEGWAENSLKNLGIDTEEYETGRVEWCEPELLEKDGHKVLYFEEYYPYERGLLIDQLFEEEKFVGKLTHLYYYVEEGANAELYETNDADGKYWPNRIMISAAIPGQEDHVWLYFKDEEEAVRQLHEQYNIPSELTTLDAIKAYVDDFSEDDEAFWVVPIDVV